MMNSRILLVLFGLLSGCASNLPKEISTPPDNNPTVEEILQDTEPYLGTFLRWGGSIASVENRKDETWLEIVARALDSRGRPEKSDQSPGRFLARVDQFLDPEIYRKGRLVTVYGVLEGIKEGKIGEQPYSFPVVRAKTVYLWAEYREPPPLPRYYWPYYDPFWDPFWPHRYYWYRDPRFW